MWSGAATTSAADPKALRGAYDAAQAAENAAGNGLKDAEAAYGEAVGDRREAEGDLRQEDGRIGGPTGLKDQVRSAGDAVAQVRQSIAEEWRKLEPERQGVTSLFDMARFYQWRFEIDYFGSWTKGILERILEDQNFGGVALLAFHAASVKLAGALLGIGTSISTALNLPQYFRVAEIGRNPAIEELKKAESGAASLAEREDSLRQREGDPHYANVLDDKRQQLAAAEREKAAAANKAKAAKGGEETARDARDKARTAYSGAAGDSRKATAALQDLGDKRAQGAGRRPARPQVLPPPFPPTGGNPSPPVIPGTQSLLPGNPAFPNPAPLPPQPAGPVQPGQPPQVPPPQPPTTASGSGQGGAQHSLNPQQMRRLIAKIRQVYGIDPSVPDSAVEAQIQSLTPQQIQTLLQ